MTTNNDYLLANGSRHAINHGMGAWKHVGENLVRHWGGTVYLRAKVSGKIIRQSLETSDLRIAKLKRDDMLPKLRKASIPDVSTAKQMPIVALVEQILTLKRANPAADIRAIETQLDTAVAALYGLTPGEIAIVEGTAK